MVASCQAMTLIQRWLGTVNGFRFRVLGFRVQGLSTVGLACDTDDRQVQHGHCLPLFRASGFEFLGSGKDLIGAGKRI